MKVTGSPTKRNSENAIRPTVSMTSSACARRRRMKAAMSARMVPHGFRAKADRLAAPPRPARAALAGHARPVSHLALGSDAAADAGGDRGALLRALSREVPRRARARARERGRGAQALERLGLLRARPQPAQGGSGHFTAWISPNGREDL